MPFSPHIPHPLISSDSVQDHTDTLLYPELGLWLVLGWCFPGGSAGKESACNAGDLGLIPRLWSLGRSPGGGNGYPLHYSYLENSVNRGAWRATVHGVAKSWTRLSDLTFTLDVLSTPGLTLLICSCPFPLFSWTFILLFVLKKCGLDTLNKFCSAPETLRSSKLGLYPPRPQLRVGRFLSFWEAPCFYLYNGPDDNP